MSKKMKRTPCDYGWTDHAFRRLQYRMANNIPEKRRLAVKRRFISLYNELVHHKVYYGLPF
jgi:hypothetical protein